MFGHNWSDYGDGSRYWHRRANQTNEIAPPTSTCRSSGVADTVASKVNNIKWLSLEWLVCGASTPSYLCLVRGSDETQPQVAYVCGGNIIDKASVAPLSFDTPVVIDNTKKVLKYQIKVIRVGTRSLLVRNRDGGGRRRLKYRGAIFAGPDPSEREIRETARCYER